MKVVVAGGSGFIGSRLVKLLRTGGHEVVAASPASGVDAFNGKGLADALSNAHVVVDVTEARTMADQAVLDFFVKTTINLLAAEAAAGVGHHVALSVVGVGRVTDSGYFRAKAAQEALIKSSSIPYTIVRSTQFFEFMETILQLSFGTEVVRVPPALVRPVSPDDVAEALAKIATAAPLNRTIDLAGPETIKLNDLARLILSAHQDPRPVFADKQARFFGAALNQQSLVPGPDAWIGANSVRDWLRHFITAD